jgi:tRNA1(Val) A37 N6-methylase TrmN6
MTARDLTDDALAGHFRVLQRRKGHRYSLDDTLTAAVAARCVPHARRVLDLGCGIGSVLLMSAYKLRAARLWGVEAQEQSFALCELNVARNGVQGRVSVHRGDLRDAVLLSALSDEAQAAADVAGEAGRDGGALAGFDLVTGTPPYQPPGQGTVSPDSQRAHARVELRGGVEDYLAAAARVVAPDGRVVVCADARTPERVARGAEAAGLWPIARLDAVPIADHKGALFSVFTLRPAVVGEARPACVRQPDFVSRDAGGGRTQAALELRRFFDLPVDAGEPASPRQRARSQSAATGEGKG